MVNLLEDIILSDFMIFAVLAGMLLVVTSWAFRTQEYPGYVLGWLVGIFFIVVYRAVTGDNNEATVDAAAETADVTLSLFTVMFASLIGLVLGFSAVFFVSSYTATHARRAVSISIMTAGLIITLFFLTLFDDQTRRAVGIFVLAFGIGTLGTMVFAGGRIPLRVAYPPQDDIPLTSSQAASENDIPRARIDPLQSRFERLRRRIEGPRR